MALTHGRTRKRHGEAVALIVFIVACSLAFWALAIALAVLIINVALN
jgi:alkylhydroperoxidase/carboxymuconolactone decarboxylase family protein YurZ